MSPTTQHHAHDLFSDVVLNIAALPRNALETLPTGQLLLVVTDSPDHMMLDVNSSMIRHEIVSISNNELKRVILDVERENGTTLTFESAASFRLVSYSGGCNILVAPNPQLIVLYVRRKFLASTKTLQSFQNAGVSLTGNTQFLRSFGETLRRAGVSIFSPYVNNAVAKQVRKRVLLSYYT
jgi:hypothetical protein